jgi:hypothetical protein
MKHTLTILIALFVMNGCVDDAPRDNPLDPESGSFIASGPLSGRIVIAQMNTGLASADVWNATSGVGVQTDSAGYFSFGTLPAGTYRLIAAKKNFTNDTFSVAVGSGTGTQVLRALNGAPFTTFQQILTRKIDQYFPSPQYFVDITATVTDPNGIAELDSVWFSADSLLFPLTYSVTTKNFHATIYKYSFPTNSIQWLVGKPLTVISRDEHHALNISEPFYITRVIENEALPVYPSMVNNDTVKIDSLYFKWTPPNVTYNYSYSLMLSRVDGGTQTVVWTLTGLDSFNEEYAFYSHPGRPALIAGNYVWTVSVVDDFGNYGRSKESAFVIK